MLRIDAGNGKSKVAAVCALAIVGAACGTGTPGADPEAGDGQNVYGTRVHVMPLRNPSGPRHDAAPAGAHLTYFGGRVVSNMQVVQVLYGTGSYLSNVSATTSPSMATFYQGVLNSAYMDWLTEYNTNTQSGTRTNQIIGRGSFLRQVQITPSAANNGATITDASIQAELAAQIRSGVLPAPTHDAGGNNNTYYAIFFPHGKTITQGGSNSCQSGGFCAYHGTIASVTGFGEVYYGVHPDMQTGSGCDTGCGTGTPFGNYTSVASHEMIETVTDCEVGLATTNAPPLAWYDNTNGEIGDICNAQQGSITGSDGVSYTVQAEFSNVANNCIVSRAVAQDFSLSASSSSLTVAAGGASATDSISAATVSGAAQTVSLSAAGQPAGVTVSFSPASVTSGGGASTMTVTASASAAAGTYSVTVTGTGTSGTHTAVVSVTVTSGTVTNDFSVSVSPASQTVAPGAAVAYTVGTAVTSGSAQTVNLSVSGLPAGVTGSFSPTSVSAGQSSTLTVAAAAGAAAATAAFTVTGAATSGTHTATASVTVTGGTGGGGLVNGGFESGLTGWTATGASETAVTTGCHGGTTCARLGSTAATNGDSSLAQTFTAPAGTTGISLWYKETCPDTITYDWALATLKDNTAGTTATLIAKACATNAWTNVNGAVTAGHSYTLTLTSHDDNYAADPTYTLFDDAALTSSAPPPPGITNGGFESGLSGWTATGASETAVTTGCHGGTTCARLGSTTATNGDSTLAQTFTATAGTTSVSLWYKETCPDTITYDWALATLKDNTAGTTATVIAKACATNAWTQATSAVTAGHSYTLTLTSHDDNYAADPTYTLFDDATLN
jgi:hypothetical protein